MILTIIIIQVPAKVEYVHSGYASDVQAIVKLSHTIKSIATLISFPLCYFLSNHIHS